MDIDNHSNILDSHHPGEDKESLSICGFWRRLFAFIIDTTFLGIFGLTIGTLFFDFFAEHREIGLLFGFAVALLYFGIQNSSLFSGQTIGKRLLKIRVVNKEARTISLQRSFARFMILGVPYFLNGALLPPELTNNYFVSIPLVLIVFAGMAAIIYLYTFNKKTRQSLHDLIIGTYVINASTAAHSSFQPAVVWRGHYAVSGFIFLAVILIVTIVMPRLVQKDFFKELLALQDRIQRSGIVYTSSVSVGKSLIKTMKTSGEKNREETYVLIKAFLKMKPSDYDTPINTIAGFVMESYPLAMEKDMIVIIASYGYDIGIARVTKNQIRKHSPEEWRGVLAKIKEV
jgi:uncharacterized RDD family membrane protein YckC